MKHILSIAYICFSTLTLMAQPNTKATPQKVSIGVERPKLIVGIVVDQMRWDFLYRYSNRYSNGGFKRLLNEGFTCENAFIPYTPTVTAAGHACIYTGSVPAINGIVGNAWWDKFQNKNVYCSEDASVKSVGSNNSNNGKMSPKNMLVTTIGDELRLATNFRSKVIGVALKDRGSILPAGHSANAAYWYDASSGNWITSTYYMQELPKWVNDFNASKMVDKYYENGWNTLYPIETYTQSTADEKPYENKPFGTDQPKFPYQLKKFQGSVYNHIATTPFGNSMTLDIAKAALENEKLGKGSETDMLCISLSSTDYVGHSFGPNSVETEDTYLRLDKDLENFLNYLDNKIGKNQYTIFLSADHGVAHIPSFMKENKLPGGLLNDKDMQKQLNALLKEKFNAEKLIVSMYNYQVHFNNNIIDSLKLDKEAMIKVCIQHLEKQEAIAQVFEISEMMETPLPNKLKEMMANGFFPSRNGEIQIVLKPGYIDGFIDGNQKGTTHGLWAPYDAHIPMIFYGWGIKHGKTNRETYMNDIAPTITALLKIQMPSGSIGKVVEEVIK